MNKDLSIHMVVLALKK